MRCYNCFNVNLLPETFADVFISSITRVNCGVCFDDILYKGSNVVINATIQRFNFVGMDIDLYCEMLEDGEMTKEEI